MRGISNAFNISRSGLTAASKWAETVSANIANADKDDYGRRTLARKTMTTGETMVTGVTRAADLSLSRMYWLELARTSKQDEIASGLSVYSSMLGGVDGDSSPVSLLGKLQAGLDTLFNDPSEIGAQRSVLQAAQSLASGVNRIAEDLFDTASSVHAELKTDVAKVNSLFERIAGLNKNIANSDPLTSQNATMQDQMTQALNELAEFMDLGVEFEADGRVGLYIEDHRRLVDFDSFTKITYVQGAGLQTEDGTDLTAPTFNAITEGRIGGKLELVTQILPRMQVQLDEFARGIIQTFEQADSSLAPNAPGLFTDNGLSFDPARLVGLASKIAVNDAVVPDQGGALWRLRDGVGAVTEGVAGDPTQIGDFLQALGNRQRFDGATGLTTDATLIDYAAAMVTDQTTTQSNAAAAHEGLAVTAASIDAARLEAQGVNIDDELQQLMLLEKSFAANSQVVSALSEMLDTLLAAV